MGDRIFNQRGEGQSFFISIPFALLKAQNVMKKRWLIAAIFL